MTQTIGIETLETLLDGLAGGPARRLVAIAGSPGSGKSTLAARLLAGLDRRSPGRAAVLPMDGFHFDDMVLEARGERPRKGAPHTFDTGGLLSALRRLRADDGESVAVPVFDRSIEIARAGARVIGPEVRLVLVEGNYLLLDAPEWHAITALFDTTVFLDVPEAELERRLGARWAHLDPGARKAKLEGNDLPNMRLVVGGSAAADYRLQNG